MELELWKLDALEAARELHKSGNHGTAGFFTWLANPEDTDEQWAELQKSIEQHWNNGEHQ